MAVPVVIVVAVADNGVIGRDNGLVWRLKTDLRRFRTLTMGRPLVMGRKTFESIGKPLPGRHCIVITRNPGYRPDGVVVASSLDEALALGQAEAARSGADSVVVGGGGDVYVQALPQVDRIHLTRVHASPEGDSHFPALDPSRFRIVREERHSAGPDDEHAFDLSIWSVFDGPFR